MRKSRSRRARVGASLVAGILCAGAALGAAAPASAGQTPPIGGIPHQAGPWAAPESEAAAVVAAARSAIGIRYRPGGENRRGFDCSGLTMWAWAHTGVTLPRTAALQHRAVQHVSRRALQPGDLVFFYHPIHHVGIYIGGGRMIEANHSGGRVGRRRVYWGHYSGGGRPSSE